MSALPRLDAARMVALGFLSAVLLIATCAGTAWAVVSAQRQLHDDRSLVRVHAVVTTAHDRLLVHQQLALLGNDRSPSAQFRRLELLSIQVRYDLNGHTVSTTAPEDNQTPYLLNPGDPLELWSTPDGHVHEPPITTSDVLGIGVSVALVFTSFSVLLLVTLTLLSGALLARHRSHQLETLWRRLAPEWAERS